MTREDRQRIQQLAESYNSSDKTYEENIQFAEEVVAQFPFSSFQILRGRRFKKFWDDVVERTAFLDEIYSQKDISRLYYYINRLQQPIVCSADNCSEIYTKKISPKMLNRFRFYCNNACAQQDSAVKQRIKKTKEANHTTTRDLLEQTRKRNQEKFGCDWFFQSKSLKRRRQKHGRRVDTIILCTQTKSSRR